MAIHKIERLSAVVVPNTNTFTDIYTVPVGRKADVNINIANSVDLETQVAIAHIVGDTSINISPEDYLLGGDTVGFSTKLLSSNLAPIEKNGVAMKEGDTIAVRSSSTALAVQINGIEEDL